jgi:uncharacterized damage-inducible protein DinB
LGFRIVPVTVAGERTVLGFNREELTRLFNLAEQKNRPAESPWLFDRFDKILDGVIRAVRQVPPERMSWTTPDRDRPLKVFCYHILADPGHVIDAIASGKYDGQFKLTYAEAAGRFGAMEEVARFGEESRARLEQASKRLSEADLARPIDGYAGKTDGRALLQQCLSHTSHHLRQLYAMLGMIGVEPEKPLTEEDFQGIQMPKTLW